MSIEATRRRALGCTDLLLLTTTASLHLEPVRTQALSTRHTVRWGGLSPLELADVRASGVRLFRMPKGMAGTLVSAYETALLFVQPQLFRHIVSIVNIVGIVSSLPARRQRRSGMVRTRMR